MLILRASVRNLLIILIFLISFLLIGCGTNDSGGTTPDIEPPSAPSNLTATALAPSALNLYWTPSTDNVGVEGYSIYRDDVKLDVPCTTSSFYDSELGSGMLYCYTVSAFDANENESGESNRACAVTKDITSPSAPSDLSTMTVSSSCIDLLWTASTDNIGVEGYSIYRDDVKISSTSDTTSFSDTELESATQYCYTVTAFDTTGNESDESDSACAMTKDITSPSTPSDLSATAVSSSQIDLSWTVSTDNIGIEGYFIYRDGAKLSDSSNTYSFSDTGLSPVVQYCYMVIAFDAEGNESDESNSACATTEPSGEEGTPKWNYPVAGKSSPAIGSDGTIYVGSSNGNLYAINPDGTLKWQYVGAGYASPTVDSDGTIYSGGLYAINPDGTLKWYYPVGTSVDSASSAAIGSDGTIYVGGDPYFYAINPNGTLKWKYFIEAPVYSSPAVGSDGTIYFGANNTRLWAMNPDGTLKWYFSTGNSIHPSPAVGRYGTIYIGSESGSLFAINPDGTLRWKYTTGYPVASPALGNDETIYVGSEDFNIYAINFDGTLKWKYLTGKGISSCPAVGNDGTIYIGSWDGNLYALNPDGTLKWQYSTGGQVWSSPAIGDDGIVYIESSGLKALFSGSSGLVNSPWPMFKHDVKHTGKY